MCTRPMNINTRNNRQKSEIDKYISHTPPESLMSAMADMQSQSISPEQTVQNVYHCMRSSISNRISIYGIKDSSVTKPRWKDMLRNNYTEYSVEFNEEIEVYIEKRNSLYFYGLQGNKINIQCDSAHLMLIDCKDVKINYDRPPVSGISILRCSNIHITENVDTDIMIDDRCDSLGFLDCEYSSNVNIVSRLADGFTLYCVGSLGLNINNEEISSSMYGQIIGRTDNMDIDFLFNQTCNGMLYKSGN